MRTRDQVGMAFGPLILRLVIGATFLWAGLGKILDTMPVQGEYAAKLANIGVQIPGPSLEDVPAAPAEDAPDAGGEDGDATSLRTAPSPQFGEPEFAFTLAYFQDEDPAFTADDFPEEVQIRKLYALSGMLHDAANPGLDEDSRAILALWPSLLAEGNMTVIFAWAAAVTEAVAGGFLVLGLMTRLSGLSLAGVMGVAMWLTQIGPAMQAGTTQYGFLPPHDIWDAQAWMPLMWQFSLMGSALALVFLGGGTLSLDRPLFGGSDEFAKAEKKGGKGNAKGSREDTP